MNLEEYSPLFSVLGLIVSIISTFIVFDRLKTEQKLNRLIEREINDHYHVTIAEQDEVSRLKRKLDYWESNGKKSYSS